MRHRRRKSLPLYSYFATWISVIVIFAGLYWAVSYIPGHGVSEIATTADPLGRFFTALYFSMITGSTVGYGDLLPFGFSRLLASVEGIVSFVLLAVFVARYSSQHQEAALDHIHSLSDDATFSNIRHGLFVARKDLDRVIQKVEMEEGGLSEKDWKNMRTAFRQIQIFTRTISKFYLAHHHEGDIDADHEQLLLDATERTLRRVVDAVQLFERRGTSCMADDRCFAEIKGILAAIEHAFTKEHGNVHHKENQEAKDELLEHYRALRALVHEETAAEVG